MDAIRRFCGSPTIVQTPPRAVPTAPCISRLQRKSLNFSKLMENASKSAFLTIDEKVISNLKENSFDKKFLDIPKEILIITMQHHQKYFHTFDNKGNITNEFFVVANNKDKKGYIKSGNERVIEARLNDAAFFWKKNKGYNLVKQISKLKTMKYFKGLGTYFDKIQRMRKLSGMISDELLISKEKIELSSSICKVDLTSDLVAEFPEALKVLP